MGLEQLIRPGLLSRRLFAHHDFVILDVMFPDTRLCALREKVASERRSVTLRR
jgi:hypothetical protein